MLSPYVAYVHVNLMGNNGSHYIGTVTLDYNNTVMIPGAICK